MADPFQGGEDGFLARLRARFADAVPVDATGIGDDAAVLPGRPRRVVTQDVLVEGEHFRFDWMKPEAIAIRAIEANLSDIAAMGAQPEALFLGLSWPTQARYRPRLTRLIDGLAHHAGERGVPLLGGDTVRAAPGGASLAITAIGRSHPGGPVLRAGGAPGDRLVVTGPLGAAAVGLALQDKTLGQPRAAACRALAREARAAFETPRARLDLARPLARHASALIDLSDGLGLDLPRLGRASNCGFRVQALDLPLHPAVAALIPPGSQLELALGGGEDFELLASIPPRALNAARRACVRAGGALYEIGRLTRARRQQIEMRSRGKSQLKPWPSTGWDPFRTKPLRALDVDRGSAVGRGDARRRPVR